MKERLLIKEMNHARPRAASRRVSASPFSFGSKSSCYAIDLSSKKLGGTGFILQKLEAYVSIVLGSNLAGALMALAVGARGIAVRRRHGGLVPTNHGVRQNERAGPRYAAETPCYQVAAMAKQR
jgi:hypothetical protein